MGARELAIGWIEAWQTFDMDWLNRHLAPGFVHVSPLGRLEGRDSYLAAVEPLARKSVNELRILKAIGEDDEAAIRFENHTGGGVIESCDWLWVDGDQIREIHSFYDSTRVRKALTQEEQATLDNSD